MEHEEFFDRPVRLAPINGGWHHSVDLGAPNPLGHADAIRRALELRSWGGHMSWNAIADVMAAYHGVRRNPTWWRAHCFHAGAERRSKPNAFARAS